MQVPCIDCGQPTRPGPRCDECQTNLNRDQDHHRGHPHERGYNWRWRKLSKRARKLQPFCSVCGSTDDLQADHTPEAWRRHEKGLPIRLQDIDVLCGECNRAAGAARGNHVTRPSKRLNPHARNNHPQTRQQAVRDPLTRRKGGE